jgi:hypothetical protein
VKILLTNNALDARAGSESYLETIAPALRRLGHEVLFFSPNVGEMAESLRRAGFSVYDKPAELPRNVDVIHGQHTNAIAPVRSVLPDTPLVFATHSWFIPVEDPLPELGAAAFIAFNERTHERLTAHVATQGKPIFRLQQPVDVSFADAARVELREPAVSAVAVNRSLSERTLAVLRDACARNGIHFTAVGMGESEVADAREPMLAADIVFAIGRTALEAMAAGRAVYVVSESTHAGWVTPAAYDGLEADGFIGTSVALPEAAQLAQILGSYTAELGSDARRLAVAHHAVQSHVAALVSIYDGVRAIPVSGSPVQSAPDFDSIARLSQENWTFEDRAIRAEWNAVRHAREAESARAHLEEVRASELELRNNLAESLADARAEINALRASTSWRLTAPLRLFRDRMRSGREQ